MRKLLGFALPLCLTLLLLCGCGAEKQPLPAQPETAGTQAAEETPQPSETVGAEEEAEPAPAEITTEREEQEEMQMKVGGTVVAGEWEHNESVEARRAEDHPLTVEMSMYGGFEQVGSLGQSLPRNDVQTTTSAGDIVLYSGNQIVVFYGSNSWAYTRLGRVSDKTAEELTALLGNGDVTITIEKSW